MKISGPHFNEKKQAIGRPACWYLSYSTPKLNRDGTHVLDAAGKTVQQRHRPFYESKALAEADRLCLIEQHDKAGTGTFLFDRSAADDYESALNLTGGIPMLELAKFWRLHDPGKPKRKLAELLNVFLEDVEMRNGKGRYYSDLKSRGTAFIKSGFAIATPTRSRVMKSSHIMRHRGSAYTLHNPYRGLDVTQSKARRIFKSRPPKSPPHLPSTTGERNRPHPKRTQTTRAQIRPNTEPSASRSSRLIR